MSKMEKEMEEEMMLGEYGEGDMLPKDYLTKQFRRKVSLVKSQTPPTIVFLNILFQMSDCTSYQSRDYEAKSEVSLTHPALDKMAQKFRRDSEIRRYEPKRRRFRRGTLESHSFTNIYQPTLKEFYFGSRQGTMHQGNISINF